MRTSNNFSSINQQALILATEALQTEDSQLLAQLGLDRLDEDLAQRLKQLKLDHLSHITNFKGCICTIQFDVNALRLSIDFATGKSREDDQINRAIRAGLRQPMLEKLKGITRREYTSRRVRMGLPEHPKGRIENLDEESELLVLRTWQQLSHITAPLDRLLALHERTGICLDRAWLCIEQLT